MLSGKGGTGKTSLAAGFWDLAPGGVFCDCDVDAANLELVLNGRVKERHLFTASHKPEFDLKKCTGCGLCQEVCRFDAIESPGRILDASCEGCGLCSRVCPGGAIEMVPVVSGEWFVSETGKGPLVHASLKPGEENSGKLVTLVRQKSSELARSLDQDIIITDGPPGIGCPVIAALSGAQLALIVTEPTSSGLHDLDRIIKVCRQFSVPVAVSVNKYDLHPQYSDKIQEKCEIEGVSFAGRIPYDENVAKAMINGVPVTRYETLASRGIRDIWDRIISFLHSA